MTALPSTMARRAAGQLPLNDAGPKEPKGTVERASEKDLRLLRTAGSIPEGMGALEAAYRLTAREFDRAERERDRWGKLNASRELRAVRERLGVIEPVAGSAADGFWEALGSNGGEPTAAAGDGPQP